MVTGSHLSKKHGETVAEIERDGIPIAVRLPILEEGATQNTPLEMARSLSTAVGAFADSYATLEPDLTVLFGDRYEMLAAAQSALLLGIPIAHIAGGERSEGAVDEAIRHSITKMSILHLVSTDSYRRRVVQLGEQPESVLSVGALVLDSVAAITFEPKAAICERLKLDPTLPIFLITLHSETLTGADAHSMADELIAALKHFPQHSIVFTGSNADAGGASISDAFRTYSKQHGPRIQFHESLGQELYLKLMKVSDAVIGNSSSGVIEAPILGVPAVNTGARQQGRLRSATVVDCQCREENIVSAIKLAISAEFRKQTIDQPHPFGSGSPAARVVEALAKVDLQAPVKRFYDC